jgi:hypothetical protein
MALDLPWARASARSAAAAYTQRIVGFRAGHRGDNPSEILGQPERWARESRRVRPAWPAIERSDPGLLAGSNDRLYRLRIPANGNTQIAHLNTQFGYCVS